VTHPESTTSKLRSKTEYGCVVENVSIPSWGKNAGAKMNAEARSQFAEISSDAGTPGLPSSTRLAKR